MIELSVLVGWPIVRRLAWPVHPWASKSPGALSDVLDHLPHYPHLNGYPVRDITAGALVQRKVAGSGSREAGIFSVGSEGRFAVAARVRRLVPRCPGIRWYVFHGVRSNFGCGM